jgi:outer membrane autotransporter protein
LFGQVDNDARRHIEFPGYSEQVRAKFTSKEYALRLGGGLQLMPAQSSWEMSLTEHLLYVGGMQAALEEMGGSGERDLWARMQKSSTSGLLNEVGISVGRRWVVRGVPVALRMQSNWVHDFDGSGSVQASFLGAPASAGWFTSRSARAERDAFRLNGSLEFMLTRRMSLRLGGDFEARRSSTRSSINISIGIEF